MPASSASVAERPVQLLSAGVPLRGYVTAPEGGRGLPAVVLCHGFLCSMAMDFPELARRLAGEGFAVLRFDYRGFGESAGEPRGELWPEWESEDARAAAAFLRGQPEADPARVALWGTSFGGAVVLHAAALDRAVQAVVANVPVTSGGAWIESVNTPESWAAVQAGIAADRERRASGAASEVVPVSAFRPPQPDPDRDAFFARHAAHVTVRELSWACVEAVCAFDAAARAGSIAPRPLLVIASPDDRIVPFSQAELAFARAGEPKRLVRLPEGTGHFLAYAEPALSITVEETVAWLRAAPPVGG